MQPAKAFVKVAFKPKEDKLLVFYNVLLYRCLPHLPDKAQQHSWCFLVAILPVPLFVWAILATGFWRPACPSHWIMTQPAELFEIWVRARFFPCVQENVDIDCSHLLIEPTLCIELADVLIKRV
jgi:hypothetical protein